MMIVNETVSVTRDGSSVNLIVVPVSYTEYARLMSKPYKRPIKSQAWRIINSSKADIIIGPNDTFVNYSIRYVKTPEPIILSDLPTGLTISNKGTKSTSCELDPIIH
jgi:hypothetical protein